METNRPIAQRLHQIDGLRALAASLVVVHHLGLSNLGDDLANGSRPWIGRIVQGIGSSGVEMFFVLSGVVLLRPYLRAGRPLNLGQYVLRRIRRLWPPFLAAWLLAGAVIYLTTRNSNWWTQSAFLPRFDWSHWFQQIGILYFRDDNYNFAWWSLSVEILFYILVPFVILMRSVFNRLSGNTDLALFCVAFILTLAAEPFSDSSLPTPIAKLAEYAVCFVGGVLLARRDLPRRVALAFIAGGILLIFAAALRPSLNVHIGWGLLYIGIVAIQVARPAGVFGSWHLVWLGERSYSLFLTHLSVFQAVYFAVSLVVPNSGFMYVIVTRAIQVPLALLVAMLLFNFVEKRFATNLVTADSFLPIKPRGGDRDLQPTNGG